MCLLQLFKQNFALDLIDYIRLKEKEKKNEQKIKRDEKYEK
tara:strand:- start:11 stop:133 length:123 start_codon:yes stop_codon:yes gene_type:complete